MLRNCSPFLQTLLGTSLTWFVTSIGSLFCFVISNRSGEMQRHVLDSSLGFSAGIMLAASFWSLLEPALEMAKNELHLGSYSVIPVSMGVLLGALFVGITELYLPIQCIDKDDSSTVNCSLQTQTNRPKSALEANVDHDQFLNFRGSARNSSASVNNPSDHSSTESKKPTILLTRRLWLLFIAITMHNIPEGLAVGIGFGGSDSHSESKFIAARNLAIGIAIQNFPEGLAISLPLYSVGFGYFRSFWYGQLSGLVEIFSGLIGCLAVQLFSQIQPFALAFAAGAMLFVILDDVIPESHSCGNKRLSSVSAIFGFMIMMCLDVITQF